MESYTLCGMLVFCYLYTALLYINGRAGLALPALALHGCHDRPYGRHLPGPFAFVSVRSPNCRSDATWGILTGRAGLFRHAVIPHCCTSRRRVCPLQRMVETSWGLGRGGSILRQLWAISPQNYFWGQINLIGLIFPPAFALLRAVIHAPPRALTIGNIFLVIGAFFGVVFFFLWTSTIGLYMDWKSVLAAPYPAHPPAGLQPEPLRFISCVKAISSSYSPFPPWWPIPGSYRTIYCSSLF